MALEDRDVEKETFKAPHKEVKASIYLSCDSLEQFSHLLTIHNLGGKLHLTFILEQLIKLGLDFRDNNEKKAIRGAFFERFFRFSKNHSLREVKNGYQLVGVADEGQAYIKEGVDEEGVFTLGPGRIYGAFLRESTAVLPYANDNIQSVQEKAPKYFNVRAHALYPEAQSFNLVTVRIYACLLRYR
jgi:hypothetical protein